MDSDLAIIGSRLGMEPLDPLLTGVDLVPLNPTDVFVLSPEGLALFEEVKMSLHVGRSELFYYLTLPTEARIDFVFDYTKLMELLEKYTHLKRPYVATTQLPSFEEPDTTEFKTTYNHGEFIQFRGAFPLELAERHDALTDAFRAAIFDNEHDSLPGMNSEELSRLRNYIWNALETPSNVSHEVEVLQLGFDVNLVVAVAMGHAMATGKTELPGLYLYEGLTPRVLTALAGAYTTDRIPEPTKQDMEVFDASNGVRSICTNALGVALGAVLIQTEISPLSSINETEQLVAPPPSTARPLCTMSGNTGMRGGRNSSDVTEFIRGVANSMAEGACPQQPSITDEAPVISDKESGWHSYSLQEIGFYQDPLDFLEINGMPRTSDTLEKDNFIQQDHLTALPTCNNLPQATGSQKPPTAAPLEPLGNVIPSTTAAAPEQQTSTPMAQETRNKNPPGKRKRPYMTLAKLAELRRYDPALQPPPHPQLGRYNPTITSYARTSSAVVKQLDEPVDKKVWGCTECPRTYEHKYTADRHINDIHEFGEDGGICCRICGMEFTLFKRAGNLQRHWKESHPEYPWWWITQELYRLYSGEFEVGKEQGVSGRAGLWLKTSPHKPNE